jgi:4-azaleucine resistance transporter AzlC
VSGGPAGQERSAARAGIVEARSELRAGMVESLPLGLALVPVGLAFGYLAHTAGLSWWLAGLMSAIVYAGPSQFIAMGLVGTGAAVPAIVATTFVTNLRYSLFAASLAPHMRDSPRARLPFLGHAIADGSYAVTIDHALEHPERPRKDQFLLGSFVVSAATWVGGTILGALAGGVVPATVAFGLGFATPAVFISFIVPYIRDRVSAIVMLAAGVGTVAGNEYLPAGAGPLLAIAGAALLGGALLSRPTRR